MAEVVDNDVVEQILIWLDATDLNRYKRVCKSWRSLITCPRFVKRHLNLSYNKDQHNNKLGHRRVSVFENPYLITIPVLLGSSNGLVCIEVSITKHIVGNPLTREIRQLPHRPYMISLDVCWGFGYDSSRDDYKVIVGVQKGEGQTCFSVLSLKSNVWRDIGEKKYTSFSNAAGVLCNGALYWMIADQNDRYSIASYDLSLEKFKEIPLPVKIYIGYNLGIMKECLCVFGHFYADDVWLLKKYSVKESWELMKIRDDDEMEYDTVHFLRFGLRKGDKASWFYRASECPCSECMAAPLFVESCISTL
ncbi:F-box/kelch-repeat protein At3g23880-like [Bidens hawaiensis]|uniref:F-box/kelch-repeat protein At3g23880-like n=1 Tax=Bidens hawaiensis TaxID=980011 RepID=UPI00404B26A2